MEFNATLAASGETAPEASVIDASGTTDEVEVDVRRWIHAQLEGRSGNP